MSITLKMKGDFELDKSVKAYSKFKKRIPNILATNTVNHFKKGFTQGGKQTNDSIGGWKKRKHRKGGNILVETGTLQRDIQKKKVSFLSTIIGTSNITSDYAEVHNTGSGSMPKREYIGDSDSLDKKNLLSLRKGLDKVFEV